MSWKRSVLDPFNLDLDMKRNLSASWYRGMPTIALSAQLGTLKVALVVVEIFVKFVLLCFSLGVVLLDGGEWG